ncbi:Cysteine synthase 2 [Sphaceloma murrayae]|uniref:Cysteine synthase 2 n=1 Tax=Sphaceloma murrayae TaxID=2082308 RepID=A0A2K1QHK6_9PEZI|nr:Cysteine synthase 2 [Sphaceloma murrayae]
MGGVIWSLPVQPAGWTSVGTVGQSNITTPINSTSIGGRIRVDMPDKIHSIPKDLLMTNITSTAGLDNVILHKREWPVGPIKPGRKDWIMGDASLHCRVTHHNKSGRDHFTIKLMVTDRGQWDNAVDNFAAQLNETCPNRLIGTIKPHKIKRVKWFKGATMRMKGKIRGHSKSCIEQTLMELGAGPYTQICKGDSQRERLPQHKEDDNGRHVANIAKAAPLDKREDQDMIPHYAYCKVTRGRKKDHVELRLTNFSFKGVESADLDNADMYFVDAGWTIVKAIDDECPAAGTKLKRWGRKRYAKRGTYVMQLRTKRDHKTCIEHMLEKVEPGSRIKCEGNSKRLAYHMLHGEREHQVQ